ncbi:peroxiredoxin family protein [Bacillus sp. DJP31]|uniref:peroxiredoxin family protein n=1 Tax=Bacillus sp. DJP31 TaxID=3409789 RepID=UPI003BB57CE3
MAKLKIGNKAPNFTLPSIGGESFTLENHQKESWKLIIFFRGSWCPACVQDLKDFEANKSYFEGKNVNLVTISNDTLDNLSQMAKEHEYTFPILSDEQLEVSKTYDVFYHGEDAPYEDHGAHGEPAYYLVDENGTLLYQQQQTSPFGRPSPTEFRKIIQYIGKNLKSK